LPDYLIVLRNEVEIEEAVLESAEPPILAELVEAGVAESRAELRSSA